MKLAGGIRRTVERELNQPRTGMQVGLKKVTLDASHVLYLLKWIEAAEKRIEELERGQRGVST